MASTTAYKDRETGTGTTAAPTATTDTEDEGVEMVDFSNVDLHGLLSHDHDPLTSGQEEAHDRSRIPPVRKTPVYCTWFSLIGAGFLFVLADVLNKDYQYIEFSEKPSTYAPSTAYTGILYLVLFFLCGGWWIRDAMRARKVRKAVEAAREQRLQELANM
eukprot:gb/GECG01012784.1/.p1 GENE.gb/GECG01012784.1/~~gb/GECG01012784.1/.p1  ORF type:complete len:160 (+),score=19.37 gb/GECG01012784.1/:1-480(+)